MTSSDLYSLLLVAWFLGVTTTLTVLLCHRLLAAILHERASRQRHRIHRRTPFGI